MPDPFPPRRGVDIGPVGPSPYDVVRAWHKPFAKQGFALGGNSGIWAESLDRILGAQRGETLAALVPKPRVNLTRFYGVFAPNAKHRALVTPPKRGSGNKARVVKERPSPAERRASMTWAKRLKRVFNIDNKTCSECTGAVKVIACIEDPKVIRQILDHLGQKAQTREFAVLPESSAPPVGLTHGLFG